MSLYWCDAHTERIETSGVDGSRRTTLYTGSSQADPFGIVVHAEYVYWTDWGVRGLFRIRRDGTGHLEQLLPGMFRGPNDLKFYNRTAALGGLVQLIGSL